MTADVIIEFRRHPSVLAYMLRGLYPSPGVQGTGGGPSISIGLSLDGEERPAILASWRSGEAAGPSFDSESRPIGMDEP